MADVDEVLIRTSEDPGFRVALRVDPRATLQPWHLSTQDLERIQAELDRLDPAGALDASPSVRALLGEA